MIDASEFASLAAAIAALPLAGGTIHLPARVDAQGAIRPYVLDTTLVVTKPVRLVGDGRGATVIAPREPNPRWPLIEVRIGAMQIERMTIDGRATRPTTSDALRFHGLGVSGNLVHHCVLRDLEVIHAGRNALRSLDTIMFEADNCSFIFSQGDGVHIDRGEDVRRSTTTTMRFTHSSFSQNAGRGVFLPRNGSGITFFGCVFEGNDGGSGPRDGAGLSATGIFRLELYACHFEDPPPGGAAQFVYVESSPSTVVDGCVFYTGEARIKPLRTASFVNSPFSRFSNNVAQRCSSEVVRFDSECTGAVEFGNRDLDTPPGRTPRIAIEGRGVTSLSSGALNIGRFFGNNRPPPQQRTGGALPGSLIWREDPDAARGESRLQISDGRAWRNVPVAASMRKAVFLPAHALRPRAGTPILAEAGSPPNTYSFARFPAGGTTALGIEWLVPPDYAPGSDLRVSAVWSRATAERGTWLCRVDHLSRGEGESLAAAGAAWTRAIPVDRGAPDELFFDVVGSGAGGIAPGEIVRLNVARAGDSGEDTYPGEIRFIGLRLEYSEGY